jgi:hypothetical protein
MAALPPWRSTDTAAQPSPLLAKLSAFLPQLAAANEAMLEGDAAAVPRIDECLVEQSKDGSDDDSDSDDASVADDDASGDDNDEPRAAKKARTAPTIQLDFAVGIDANDPVMSLLESGGHDDSNGGDDNDVDNKDANPDEDAQVVMQNLLRRPAARQAKGPLITEVLEEP